MSTNRNDASAIHYRRETVTAGIQYACGNPPPLPGPGPAQHSTEQRDKVTCSACLRLADAFERAEFVPRQGYGSSNANPRGGA